MVGRRNPHLVGDDMSILTDRTWSISAVRSYLTCPRQWWLTRVAHVEQEVSSESCRGQLLHAGLAAGYMEMDRAQREPERWLPDVIARRTEAAVVHGVAREAARLQVDDVDEAMDTACRTMRYLGPRPGDGVLGVERELSIRMDGVPITYRADVVYRRQGRLVVRDWKSSSQLPRRRDVPRNWQLALGALCAACTFDVTGVEVAAEIASIASAVTVTVPITPDKAWEAGQVVVEAAHLAELELQRPVPFAPERGEACGDCPVRRFCPLFAEPGMEIPIPRRDGSVGLMEVKP